jgi:hypothetical protein
MIRLLVGVVSATAGICWLATIPPTDSAADLVIGMSLVLVGFGLAGPAIVEMLDET